MVHISIVGLPLGINEVDEGENRYKLIFLTFIQATSTGGILLCSYLSILHMPFGDALTIIFTSPIFTMMISTVYLKERCKCFKVLCAVTLFVGVLFVLQPPILFNATGDGIENSGDNKESSEYSYYFGASMALVASVAGAFHYVIVGRLFKNSTTNSAMLLAFHGGFGAMLVIIPAAFIDKNQSIFSKNIFNLSGTIWIALLLVAVLGLIAFVAINLSLKYISPVYVSFIGVLEIVMAYVSQVLIFKTMPNLFGIMGSFIVVATVFVLPLETIIAEKMPRHIKHLF